MATVVKLTKVKPATPWNVTLAKLTALEHAIADNEQAAMRGRWQFGRELVTRRVDYKGRLTIPRDLMTATIARCAISRREINYRVQFALRYPNKQVMCNAVAQYKTWHRLVAEGLVDKKRPAAKKKLAPFSAQTLTKMSDQLQAAFQKHTTLTRDQVKAIEQLVNIATQILEHVDRNDAAKAS